MDRHRATFAGAKGKVAHMQVSNAVARVLRAISRRLLGTHSTRLSPQRLALGSQQSPDFGPLSPGSDGGGAEAPKPQPPQSSASAIGAAASVYNASSRGVGTRRSPSRRVFTAASPPSGGRAEGAVTRANPMASGASKPAPSSAVLLGASVTPGVPGGNADADDRPLIELATRPTAGSGHDDPEDEV